jgi:hypothetical protein
MTSIFCELKSQNLFYIALYSDVVLQDFCDILDVVHPASQDYQRKWFRNVFTEPVGEMTEVCDDRNAIHVTQSSECTILPSLLESETSKTPATTPATTPFMTSGSHVKIVSTIAALAQVTLLAVFFY